MNSDERYARFSQSFDKLRAREKRDALVEKVARAMEDADTYYICHPNAHAAATAALTVALEEAAKECDTYAQKDWNLGEGFRNLAAIDLAAAIRALVPKGDA